MPKKGSPGYVPKNKFTPEEDDELNEIIEHYGTSDWEIVASHMKKRTARQCRERWVNYLAPELSNQPWTAEEDKLLDELYNDIGSRWHKIAQYFHNRSGNCIRNRFKLRQRREQRLQRKQLKQQTKQETPAPEVVPEVKMINLESFKTDDTIMDLFPLDKTKFEDWFIDV
ncbi:Myb-like DNA-binding domain containing protein [Trichomonas vaginalis G3]|uniref:Myb-like DNA-binding domain containing protein n=1 Tax=Trichomonas vaginalis (strain ATCC PRA-98 / G3) TaxID=412133 RepID=A2FTG2_TRIV3|nr:RNA polymerase II transcription regulator recruiting protein [Trichomonas vaginalis G3]EAX91812.1 Myb-like DNA-binding domain containing protein [Trichomonas vaginalis G3]KAI5538263.1 RNA polymerase II transcription regulator recruiting protein [Trichomonas vaginalis G3]|eukprot:XP_001304742.1 Myb-like DNA-binding domain containing protein [Trichomonas vaginalis G3]